MLQTIGTLVALLACPLMMVFMMKGMRGMHGDGNRSANGSSRRKSLSKEGALADLGSRMQDLKTEYERLAADAQEVPEHSHHSKV